MENILTDFAKNYYILGLRIDKHIPGYVEHYYGPSDLKKQVLLEEKRSPKKLLIDCSNLVEILPNQGFDEKRLKFLNKNLNAIEAILHKLNGEQMAYLELVEKLFDFKPILYEEEYFYNLTTLAESCYKGNGSLSERIYHYTQRRTIPVTNLKPLFKKALLITQERTNKLFPNLLPSTEQVEIEEVTNKSWTMYNWYLGDYQSRIEINIDRRITWSNLLYFASHEAYPGHHSERVIKEHLLFRIKNFFESAILLIYSPEMVISEGMGLIAEDILFSPIESSKILLDFINQNKANEDDEELLIKQIEVRRGFLRFESNLAYHKHVDLWSDKHLIEYAKSFEVYSDEAIKGMIRFISDEIWAPYSLAYQGERLIVEKFGKGPTPKQFKSLLTAQVLPSELV